MIKPEDEWFKDRQVAFINATKIINEIDYQPEIDDIIKVAKFLVGDEDSRLSET